MFTFVCSFSSVHLIKKHKHRLIHEKVYGSVVKTSKVKGLNRYWYMIQANVSPHTVSARTLKNTINPQFKPWGLIDIHGPYSPGLKSREG